MCGCLQVYSYLVGRLNIRALLDQHSHRFHVTVQTSETQRCPTELPSQPASVRRSVAAAATPARSKGAGVGAWTFALALCVPACVYEGL
jgi:hypothetical protein